MSYDLLKNVSVPPIPLLKAMARELSPQPTEVFDLTQAVPSFATFAPIRAQLCGDLGQEAASFYTDIAGLPALRHAIVETHPLGRHFGSHQVGVTAGANQAFFASLVIFFQAGDRVVLPEPYYFNYDMALRMLGMEPVYHPMRSDQGFRLDADALIRTLETSGAKGVVLITPNNPTGACYAPDEVLKLVQYAAPRGIEVLLDETYRRFDPGHLAHGDLGAFVGHGLTLIGSFSKVYSVTGYRVGYVVTSELAMQAFLKVQDTMVICAPHISQLAALHGLQLCEPDVVDMVHRIATLSQVLKKHAAACTHFELLSVGAFFAYVRHPLTSMSCTDATLEIFRQTGVLGLPGTTFGEQQQAYVRLAYCNVSADELERAMANLSRFDPRAVKKNHAA